MTVAQPIRLTEIIKGQIYLGNLAAALFAELKAKLGITHIVSVCPDYASTSSNHLVIPIEDSEYDDLLIHLPVVCEFIEDALKEHGRVLVHCVMGISRSASAIAAYLMKSRRILVADAIRYLKQLRPIVHPNYGFIRQLHVFEDCAYRPSQYHARYLSWKRRHKQDVKTYINFLEDTFPLVHDKVLLTSDYPEDTAQAQSYVLDLGITKIISIVPAELPLGQPFTQHERFHMANSSSSHLGTLDAVCRSVHEVIDKGGQALLYCANESELCVAACAFCEFHLECRRLGVADAGVY
ncbi:protein-tyrosine phosphatase-like protein [Panaeolus papilionaceus]|nr:protein-tyrosine phosphatase-like protein [Panaeolus papilionaceus]